MLNSENPYLFIYLLGCIFVVIFIFIQIFVFLTVSWAVKENIFNINTKKVTPPDSRNLREKATSSATTVILMVAMSWLSVIDIAIQIFLSIINLIRELLAQRPEKIKQLRYPLRNNPDLPPESVWAYLIALKSVDCGEHVTESELIDSLDELCHFNPLFNREHALAQLDNLNILNKDTIKSCLLNYSQDEIKTAE